MSCLTEEHTIASSHKPAVKSFQQRKAFACEILICYCRLNLNHYGFVILIQGGID